jgi:hypothetical protein
MKFSNQNSHKSVLNSLKTFFPSQTITMQLSKDQLSVLYVISSLNALEGKLIQSFKFKNFKKILYTYYTDQPTNNLYAACATHNYSQWFRVNEAPAIRQRSLRLVKEADFSKLVRVSEFRVTHSVVIIEQPTIVDITRAASVLSILRSSKAENLFQFNSATLTAVMEQL